MHNILVDGKITFTFGWTFLKPGLGYPKSDYRMLFIHHLVYVLVMYALYVINMYRYLLSSAYFLSRSYLLLANIYSITAFALGSS